MDRRKTLFAAALTLFTAWVVALAILALFSARSPRAVAQPVPALTPR